LVGRGLRWIGTLVGRGLMGLGVFAFGHLAVDVELGGGLKFVAFFEGLHVGLQKFGHALSVGGLTGDSGIAAAGHLLGLQGRLSYGSGDASASLGHDGLRRRTTKPLGTLSVGGQGALKQAGFGKRKGGLSSSGCAGEARRVRRRAGGEWALPG
jgi:hypothetical protein